MKLSVIIPCFNASATLAVQLDALSNQNWSEPWELIIADNGSTDNSIEIAQKYKDKFYAFKIVDASQRRGGAYAVNKGISEASAENVAVCDADDEVSPDWLTAIGNALNKYNIVCGQFKFDKFNASSEAERATKRWKDGLFVGKYLPGGGSGNFGIKKSIHQSIGGFEENLLHAFDADYFWRLQLTGYRIHFIEEAAIQIRLGRVNPTFKYMLRRGKNRSASNYWCYKRYKKHGMSPPSSFSNLVYEWFRLLNRGIRISLRNRDDKAEWLLNFALKTGNIIGEIQGRIANPLKPFNPKQ